MGIRRIVGVRGSFTGGEDAGGEADGVVALHMLLMYHPMRGMGAGWPWFSGLHYPLHGAVPAGAGLPCGVCGWLASPLRPPSLAGGGACVFCPGRPILSLSLYPLLCP